MDTLLAPDARLARRVLRAVPTMLLWAAFAVAAFLLWPTNLGGCTTLTIVTGQSMEPTFHTGDLVVTRCTSPSVGDVIVYQPHELDGPRIIHRVIGGDASGWEIQGDNNDWVDPFSPTGDEVLGVQWFSVPKVGLAVQAITSPWIWASLIVLAIAILVWPRDDDEDDEGADETPAAAGPPEAVPDLEPAAPGETS
ncbi:signal peptidase I [Cellulomonas sp.]|uniref:signal peptidase I n=1 Tax=Cellulomonas sp. TaxID=40001 RepID=UPI003BA8AC47